MKILQVNASYKPAFIYGGPTMSVSQLSEGLARQACTIEVFATTANGDEELNVLSGIPRYVDGVRVTYFNRITKDNSHFSPLLLTTLWSRAREFDVIHVHAWWNTVSVLSCLISCLRGVPFIISPRGTLSGYTFTNRHSFYKKIIHLLLGKWLLRKSGFHVTSQQELNDIQNLVAPGFIAELPNFIELGPSRLDAARIPSGSLKLLFLSRIEEKKGLDILLDALAQVAVPYHLTIAGNGSDIYLDQLKAQAKALNLTECITWVGFQKKEKFELFKKNNLLVLPSHDENFGNVVIESLSVGTPVLISEHVGLADYIRTYEFGWVCQLTSDDIARQINNIWENQKDQLTRIQEKAPARILDDFDPETLTRRYLKLYYSYLAYTKQK